MSKVSTKTINNMVNSILKPYRSKNREPIARDTVDATSVKVDINHIKFIKPEDLEELNLNGVIQKPKEVI